MKIWRAILILTCFSILFFAPQISYGQAVQPCDTAETIGTAYPCRDSQGRSWGSFAERQNAMNAAGAAEMAKKNESKPTGRVQVCPAAAYEKFSLANMASIGILPALCGIVDFTLSGIGWALAGLMYLCATLLDYSFDSFVLHIATMFQDEDGTDKAYIYGAWTAIRDLANIAAFFAAVYAGFLRIIGQDRKSVV